MAKYIIVFVVVLIAVFGTWFLISNRSVVETNIHTLGNNLQVTNQYGTEIANNVSETTTSDSNRPITNISNKQNMKATIHTNQGNITIEFFGTQAPNTVANFRKLAEQGFYNGVKFHRVIKGFMIQGGDPLTKDDSKKALWGTGGPGYSFADEITSQNRNDAGTISMANAGPNTNGSQFFINVANNNFLDTKHTVFGKVVAGMDVVTKIENTPTDSTDRPTTAVMIEGITLQ